MEQRKKLALALSEKSDIIAVMSWSNIGAVLASALSLTLILLALGLGTAVFWHSFLGETVLAGPVALPSFSPPREAMLKENITPSPVVGLGEIARKIVPAAFEVLPSRVLIDAPFSVQAPLGDWSQPYKDACEETSVAMSIYWARREPLDLATSSREILNQVAFEEYNFGYHRDTALKETLNLFLYHYRYPNVKLYYDIAVADIKRELAEGNLVIVPAAGELLANPYFKTPPPYHMLVIRGYDEAAGEFITNDPGTVQGEGFRYSFDNLYDAIRDWPGPDRDVRDGHKGMIVVYPADWQSSS